METTTDKGSIQTAKLFIMAEVPYVRKTKGKDLPYSYAGERAFIINVRPVMLKHGVTVAPIATEFAHNGTLVTSSNKTMAVRVVLVTYRFTHADSGTYEDVQVAGEGADSLDKATPKAMTGAFKHALRQWLMIETGDDPDKIGSVDASHLSDAGSRASDAIEKAGSKSELDSIAKRVAASQNIPAAERAYLSDLIASKSDEVFSLLDADS